MPDSAPLPADISRLQHRPVYGTFKRAKRGVLRAIGRWPRAGYDVQLVFEHGRAAYKKITFNDHILAARIADNLYRFGASQHLPRWRHTSGRRLWIEYVAGRPYSKLEGLELEEIARFFTQLAGRGSRRLPTKDSGYWTRHQNNLVFLRENGLIDAEIADILREKSLRRCPPYLRIGFDYRDPIAPNLVQRSDNGAFCAVDIKNWHAETLVGEGLAKTTDRWLDPESRGYVLDHMSNNGLGDIAEAFDFLEIYERCSRISNSVRIETAALGSIKKRRAKTARLISLAR